MGCSYEQWLFWCAIGAVGNLLVCISVNQDYIDGRSDFFYWYWYCVGCVGARIAYWARQRLGYLSPFCRGFWRQDRFFNFIRKLKVHPLADVLWLSRNPLPAVMCIYTNIYILIRTCQRSWAQRRLIGSSSDITKSDFFIVIYNPFENHLQQSN